jgi:hypothetical protein
MIFNFKGLKQVVVKRQEKKLCSRELYRRILTGEETKLFFLKIFYWKEGSSYI